MGNKGIIVKLNQRIMHIADQKKSRFESTVPLILLLFLIASASFVFLYSDLVDMACNSSLLLRAIKDGEFSHFYTYSLENAFSQYPANYNIFVYIIFAVWLLPVSVLFNFEVNIYVYLWLKLLIVLCIVLCAFLMYRISILLNGNERLSVTAFLIFLLSSPLVFIAEFVACQYDCIGMVFILAGLYEYLKDRELRSLIFFCLAFPVKSFAVFVFIPLLLYKEKNLLKILLKLAVLFVIPVISGLLFANDPAYSFLLGSQNRDAVSLIADSFVSIGSIRIHVFIIMYLAICYCCYFNQYDRNRVLLICASVYTLFIIFVEIRSYWVFLMEPFLILLVATGHNDRISGLCHTAAQITGSVFFVYDHWIYNTGSITRILGLPKMLTLPSVVKYGSFVNFVNVHGLDVYIPLFRTVFIGSSILILVLNLWNSRERKMTSGFSMQQLVCIRMIFVAGLFSLLLFLELYPCSRPVIDTLNYGIADVRPYWDYNNGYSDNEDGAGNTYDEDLNEGALVVQPFLITDTRKISELSFQCAGDNSRANRTRLRISIVNNDTGENIREIVVGTSLLKTRDVNIIRIPDTILSAGNYSAVFSAVSTPEGGDFRMIYSEGSSAEACYINGEKKEHPICLCIN